LGTFHYDPAVNDLFALPSGTPDPLDYTERSLLVTINQLLGKEVSLVGSYRLVQAQLKDDFTRISDSPDDFIAGFRPHQRLDAVLHQVVLDAVFNHPAGGFADFQALWSKQSNQGYLPDIPGDNFWHFNAFVGYRFPRRRAEVRVGLLNLTDQDYRLNPLTLYNELPRTRTLAVRFQFKF
jgi:hypothetical protein